MKRRWILLACVALLCAPLRAEEETVHGLMARVSVFSHSGNYELVVVHPPDGRQETLWVGTQIRSYMAHDRMLAQVEVEGRIESIIITPGGANIHVPFEITTEDETQWSVRSWNGDIYTILAVQTPHRKGVWVSRDSDRKLLKVSNEFITINAPGYLARKVHPIVDERTGECIFPANRSAFSLSAFDSDDAISLGMIERHATRLAPSPGVDFDLSPSLEQLQQNPLSVLTSPIWDRLRVPLEGQEDGKALEINNMRYLSWNLSSQNELEHASARAALELMLKPEKAAELLELPLDSKLSDLDYVRAVEVYASCHNLSRRLTRP